mgnify:CR=1 FL=1
MTPLICSALVFALLSAAVPSATAERDLRPGEHLRSVEVDGRTRRYLVQVPASYSAQRETPVVLAFHGGGGNPQSMIRLSRLNEKSEEAGFLVVYPYGTGVHPDRGLTFNGGGCCGYAMKQNVDDVGFVEALLDDLGTVAEIDDGAVFATGLSNGAIMAHRLAAELSERIAAIAPVGGPLMLATIDPERPVAVLHFHGTSDRLAPFDGGYGENARGGRGVTEFRSVDHSLQAWVHANGCDPTPESRPLPDTAEDGTRVIRHTWAGGEEGTEVVSIEIEGGGHTWPGVPAPRSAAFLGRSTEDISANDLMWAFFQKHRRGQAASEEEAPAAGNREAMDLLRTPDERFADLPGYAFEPRYLFVDDPNRPPGNRRIRMHSTVSGPAGAPAVLMLHGNPSWSFLFRKIVPPINQAGYRTVLVDLVGHGKSDKPTDLSDYTYDRHLQWLRQAFAQLDADPDLALNEMVWFGHDYGHPLGARLMAEHYPERFDGFINGNAGLNRGRWGLAERHQGWRRFVRSTPRVPVGAVICRNRARQRLGLPDCPEAVEAGYDAPYPSGDYQASIRAFPEMVPEDASWPEAKANQVAWAFLTTFQRPYMVIWEAWDSPDPRNRRAEYISEIPGAFGLEQPQLRTGHYAPEDDPEGVAAAVIRFLDDLYAPQPFHEMLRIGFKDKTTGPASENGDGVREADEHARRLTTSDPVLRIEGVDLSKLREVKIAFRYLPENVGPEGKLTVELGPPDARVPRLTLQSGSLPGTGDFRNGSTDYGYLRLHSEDVAFASNTEIVFRFEGTRENAAILLKEIGVFGKEPPKTIRTHSVD